MPVSYNSRRILQSLLVHGLAKAYKLLEKMRVVQPQPLSAEDLKRFHSADFIDFLMAAERERGDNDATDSDDSRKNFESDENDEDGQTYDQKLEEFGLEHDCPVFPGLADYVRHVAGGSVAAARELTSGRCDVAVCWDGGRSEAHGFCYVSDVALAIIELRAKFDRVMYIDLDIHHGDGVEGAFLFTDKVLTVSLHRYGQGFFPGTGAVTTIGKGKGTGYTLNVPLKSGLRGATLERVFDEVVLRASERFGPNAVVVQCGADGLTGDPVGEWNVSAQSIANCVKRIVGQGKPVLLLGGGGYNSPNVARCYVHILSQILRVPLKTDIPEHPYFELYTPDFSLFVDEGNQRDWNDKLYVDEVIGRVQGMIDWMR
ncbi:hypothetical protein BC936DRAFT_150108 [Jimgerdemannia flammicorona]|uniref:Histone deacetylase 8 n=1 Tax=Jimgerdemannia flammicorona TaxID=994334 RepID=A0A433CZH2_9FUNG|nr:hypothetical protein BC936DRAFT_150108 [Jimgerdemannia flammicorona]